MTNPAFNRRRFLSMSACAWAMPALAETRHRWQGLALGSDVMLTVQSGPSAAARVFFAEAARTLRGIERQFSLFTGSELRRLNAMGRLAHLSDDLLAVLRLAARVKQAILDPRIPAWLLRN